LGNFGTTALLDRVDDLALPLTVAIALLVPKIDLPAVVTTAETAAMTSAETTAVAPFEATAVTASKAKGNSRWSAIAIVTWRRIKAARPSPIASAVSIANQTYGFYVRVSGNRRYGKCGCRPYRKYCPSEGDQPYKCISQFHTTLLSHKNSAEEQRFQSPRRRSGEIDATWPPQRQLQ
jgi:hypothetical protein